MIARRNGDYARAAAAFQAAFGAAPTQQPSAGEAQFRLGEAYWLMHNDARVIGALTAYLQANPSGSHAPEVHYFLSDAYWSQKDWDHALAELRLYRSQTQTLAGDTDAGIADLLVLAGNPKAALAQYERALQDTTLAAAARISILMRMADVHTGQGEPNLAAGRYDAALALAGDARTRADLNLRAGEAYAAAHLLDDAVARWKDAVAKYPDQPGAFQALVNLVDRGVPVDDFQRGYVDYFAGSYDAAINALQRYLKDNPAPATTEDSGTAGAKDLGEARYFLASAYARKGAYSQAIGEYDTVIKSFPKDKRVVDAYLGKASAYAAIGKIDDAVAVYKRMTAAYPSNASADDALWRAALLLDRAKRPKDANALYEQLQAKYPTRERAAEALFWAGLNYYLAQDFKTATARWQSITKDYGQSPFYARALFWLGKAAQARGQSDAAKKYWQQASALPPTNYYSARAADALSPRPAKTPNYDLAFYAMGTDAERVEFDKWLAGWAKSSSTTALGTLDSATLSDLRFRRGTELLRLDRTVEARREFAALIAAKQDEPRALYALALHLRDINLYSLSIDCADRIARLAANAGAPAAPRFLLLLRFPTFYADLVVAEAKANQVDPLLYFALMRQESGFNPWATSSADARGLAQIIPSTARDIAQRLGIKDFDLDQLYLPYLSVRFGVWYFAQDLKQFDNNPIYALAAYNAGAGRAKRWQRPDIDLAVEGVDASETNSYIRLVYGYWRQYQTVYR
jgi:soluble lytic murein transglycosylase